MRRRFLQRNNSEREYLIIEPLEDGLITCEPLTENGLFYYRIDGGSWNSIFIGYALDVRKGQKIEFKGNGPSGDRGIGRFNSTATLRLSGNCLSLLFGDNASGQKDISMYENCFYMLFAYCKIAEVSDTFLPATKLSPYCYESMFHGNKSLTKAPNLPATELAKCCYLGMFYNCTSLTTAPELPAITLVEKCYYRMFYGNTALNYIKALFTTRPVVFYTEDWVYGVASTGTFVKNPDATWDVVGDNGVPSGWTVKFDGEEDVELLEFTVDGVAYQFEEGMTWADWCDSSYNTVGFKFYLADSGWAVYTSDYKKYFKNNMNPTALVEAGVYETGKVDWPMPKG